MKSLRFFAVAMLGLVLVAGLVACGGSSSDSGSSSYTASGTYIYTPTSATTGVLSMTIDSSTYPTTNCNGSVEIGQDIFDVADLSATTMTWDPQGDDIQWTGSNSGDITGTWKVDYNGTTYYTAVFTDTTVSVTSPTSVCSIQ